MTSSSLLKLLRVFYLSRMHSKKHVGMVLEVEVDRGRNQTDVDIKIIKIV